MWDMSSTYIHGNGHCQHQSETERARLISTKFDTIQTRDGNFEKQQTSDDLKN